MARRFIRHVCRPLSPEAAAWEARMLREMGLEDVPWDGEQWCAICADHARKAVARDEGRAPSWKMWPFPAWRTRTVRLLVAAAMVAEVTTLLLP